MDSTELDRENAPSGATFYYSVDGNEPQQFSEKEIRELIAAAPNRRHLVWKDGWSEWRPAEVVFSIEPAPSEKRSTAQMEAPKPESPTMEASHGMASTEAAKGSRKWIYVGGSALLLFVVFVVIALLQKGTDADALLGRFKFETESVFSWIDISRSDEGSFHIEGESLYGTNREYGPNIGTLSINAELQDGVLIGMDEPDYIISIRSDDGGIVVEETGSNENFGMNVSFAGTYNKVTVASGSEDEKTSGSKVTDHSEEMATRTLPQKFKAMIENGELFSYAYDDLEIESKSLPGGWYEVWIYLMNQEPYGGSSEVASRVGTYRYNPASDELMMYDAVTDSYAPWTVDDRIIIESESGELTPAERNSIEDFVYSIVRAQNQNDVSALLEYYADEVDYYSWGIVSRDRIREDKEAYFKRWSVRNYSIQSGEISIAPSDVQGVYHVSYGVDYAVESPERGKRSTGLALTSLVIETKALDGRTNSGFRVTKENSE